VKVLCASNDDDENLCIPAVAQHITCLSTSAAGVVLCPSDEFTRHSTCGYTHMIHSWDPGHSPMLVDMLELHLVFGQPDIKHLAVSSDIFCRSSTGTEVHEQMSELSDVSKAKFLDGRISARILGSCCMGKPATSLKSDEGDRVDISTMLGLLTSAMEQEVERRHSCVVCNCEPPHWSQALMHGMYETAAEKAWEPGNEAALLYACLVERFGMCLALALRSYLCVAIPAVLPLHKFVVLLMSVPERTFQILMEEGRRSQTMEFAILLLQKITPATWDTYSAMQDHSSASPAEDEKSSQAGCTTQHTGSGPAQLPKLPPSFRPLFDRPLIPSAGPSDVDFMPFCAAASRVLNKTLICSGTARAPCEIASELVPGTCRALCKQGRPFSPELESALAELQKCRVDELEHEPLACFWLNCLNAGVLAGAARSSSSLPQAPHKWANLMRETVLDVKGQELSLLDIENLALQLQQQNTDRVQGDAQLRYGKMFLRRPFPEVIFGVHMPVAAGMPPLRVFRQGMVKAQLLLNCVHCLVAGICIHRFWRRVTLPEVFRKYMDLAGIDKGALLKFVCGVLFSTPDVIVLLKQAANDFPFDLVNSKDESLVQPAVDWANRIEALRKPSDADDAVGFAGVAVEFSKADWTFVLPGKTTTVCPTVDAELGRLL